MITIKTYDHARKLTQALFSFTKKEKYNLNSFRSLFASECGLNELQDAFKKDNEEKRAILLSQYITHLDDPRITIEVARKISDDYDKAEKYFNEKLSTSEGVLFPIKSETELLKRCAEILIIFNELEFYNINSLFIALLKISFNQHRIENYSEELSIAVEYIKQFGLGGSGVFDYHKNIIDFNDNDITEEDGYFGLLNKLKIMTHTLVWTKSSCGSFVSEEATKNEKQYR